MSTKVIYDEARKMMKNKGNDSEYKFLIGKLISLDASENMRFIEPNVLFHNFETACKQAARLYPENGVVCARLGDTKTSPHELLLEYKKLRDNREAMPLSNVVECFPAFFITSKDLDTPVQIWEVDNIYKVIGFFTSSISAPVELYCLVGVVTEQLEEEEFSTEP